MSDAGSVDRTGLRPGSVSSVSTVELSEGWLLASTAPDEVGEPAGLDAPELQWRPAVVPGTVAQAVGPADLDAHPSYDAHDWWYRCTFTAPEGGRAVRLCLDGLATVAQVWLNGRLVQSSSNMFTARSADVTDAVRKETNELVIAFRSLHHALARRRPRPRWKTKLVDHQQLRWFRTTLLGRIPGWTPPVEPVGPWRSVRLETIHDLRVESLDVQTAVEGSDGVVRVDMEARVPADATVGAAYLQVDDVVYDLDVGTGGDVVRIAGEARVAEPELWWPRTHGEPTLHACSLVVETAGGATKVDCGRIGFREISVDRTDGRVQLLVNGTPVFCRGACWTSNDMVSLSGDPETMRRTLELAAEAHANMVRIGGTMVYESDAFYEACDELGLMVWQDFMFANMDYPVGDSDFLADVEAEAEHQLRRLQRHPSVVAFCGGSEVEQQAAMFGAPRDVWSNAWFQERLPDLVHRLTGGTPYWTSTPTGGALPFHVGEGLAHYYGIGAYLRPLEDVRTAGVKFTPECLGFSNVPEPENLRRLSISGVVAPHHPAWKAGVPRDTGAGWDFEDVRDHYLRRLYGVDPVTLRSEDPDRYLALSRVVTGRVMAHAFDEWRSPESACAGGLVWFLKDLRPGAGWGIIDSDNRPKPVYWYLRRAWAPVRVALLDRGLDGLRVEIHNETDVTVEGRLQLTVLGWGSVKNAMGSRDVCVGSRSVIALSFDDVMGYFMDSTYAYRFGPLAHAAVVAELERADPRGALVEVRWSSLGEPLRATELRATGKETEGNLSVSIDAEALAREVRVDSADRLPDDNYFDLVPGWTKSLLFRARAGSPPPASRTYVEAANGSAVRVGPPS